MQNTQNTNFKTKYLNAKTLSKIGLFTAVSFILTFLEFPIFPLTPFLKLDFSNVLVLIGGFYLGPFAGGVILFIKELLCLLKTSTPVGQLANFIIGLSFILFPIIFYNSKKTFNRAIIGLVVATILQVLVSLIVNKFINFPLYGVNDEFFNKVFWFIVAFNFIKGVAVSVLTLLLYKRIKKVLDF